MLVVLHRDLFFFFFSILPLLLSQGCVARFSATALEMLLAGLTGTQLLSLSSLIRSVTWRSNDTWPQDGVSAQKENLFYFI